MVSEYVGLYLQPPYSDVSCLSYLKFTSGAICHSNVPDRSRIIALEGARLAPYRANGFYGLARDVRKGNK
jgi:hypothetical protein